jgi:cytochrome c-type biogenesis protein CcmH/NrfG
MRLADAHLNPQEFESVLFGSANSSSVNTWDAQTLEEAQQHLKVCAACQAAAERYRKADEMLNGLGRASQEPQRGVQCPAQETWELTAAGLLEADEAKVCVAHAAICDYCGRLLKEAMEDLAQDLTPEEEETLAAIPSASAGWQHEAGQRLAAGRLFPDLTELGEPPGNENRKAAYKNEKRFSLHSVRFAWASAAALLGIAVWIGWRATREPDVNQLLAQSYQDQRTIQLRMAGAKYSPVRTTRGSAGSHTNPPESLLKAESRIRRGLEKAPVNLLLLDQQGRAELLEGNYSAAIAALRKAKDLADADSRVAVDLATAYFQKAEAEDNPADGQTAAELLSAVLRRNSEDEIALFNRAVVYQRLSRYQDAINDWEHYLRVSRDEQWDGEARQYLAQMKKEPQ